MIAPLRTGDTIALIAPSSPFDPKRFEEARLAVEAEGYRLAPGGNIFHGKGYLAGTEAERADDLIETVSDPAVSAIICIRGGYGSARMLPWLPFSMFRNKQKIFMGYSDATFLHLALCSQAEWITFHGPNFVSDSPAHAGSIETALRTLQGESDFSWNIEEAHVIKHGTSTGRLIGGNLTCMVHLLGTPFFPDPGGAILLIEDRGEALYRLDRHLTHLALAGVLPRLGGMVLGNFDGCGDIPAIWEMVSERVRPFRFPVVAGLPFGHGCENRVIPLGIPFYLNTRTGIFKADRNPFSG